MEIFFFSLRAPMSLTGAVKCLCWECEGCRSRLWEAELQAVSWGGLQTGALWAAGSRSVWSGSRVRCLNTQRPFHISRPAAASFSPASTSVSCLLPLTSAIFCGGAAVQLPDKFQRILFACWDRQMRHVGCFSSVLFKGPMLYHVSEL